VAGEHWENPFDLGPMRNWQEVFDERGRFWFVTWALPRRRLHSKEGLYWPTTYNIEEHSDANIRSRGRTKRKASNNDTGGRPGSSSSSAVNQVNQARNNKNPSTSSSSDEMEVELMEVVTTSS
jgi:hypothetical protein